MIIHVPKKLGRGSKRGLNGDAILVFVHVKVVLSWVEEFRGAGMSRELAKVVAAHYKTDSTDLEKVSFLAGQRAFVLRLGNDCTHDEAERMCDGRKNGT